MTNFIKSFAADQSGASAAEYALILAIVGAGIGAAAWVLGDNVRQSITTSGTKVLKCGTATGTPGTGGAAGTAPTGC